ncbi:MAG: hypothetical protein HGA36_03080 [Candidatus Moranbacteria bacterium]|nr:hypothetical protein [Candidatus Moranbacteria bacterium]
MDIDKAKEIIEKMDISSMIGEKNTVMHGLQILAKYEENVMPQFDHDIIWASDFDKTVMQMPEEDVLQMAKLGWYYDTENDCWAHC